MLYEGGWVMVPLFLCSILGLAIIVERLFALRRNKVLPQNVVDLLNKFNNE